MTQNLNGLGPNVPKKKTRLTAGSCFTCRPVSRKYWVFGCGAFWLVLAIVVGVTWPIGTTFLLHKALQIDKIGSMGYDNWIVMPNDMFMRFMMFNWTNPEDIEQPDYKPNFVEMGPYVFLEKHVRVNVTFHPENGTVSYDQIRTYFFMPEMSNGTLDDNITNINVVAASAAYTLRDANSFILWSADKLMKAFKVQLVVTKTVGELLFDGYSDAFLTALKKLPIPNKPPFDKFGYFVDRNGSWSYDGHLEMHSGQNDVKKLGMLTKWNYVNKTRFQKKDSECSEVYGTTGEPWPLDINPTGEITVFIMDICRPVTLIYDKEYIYNDVKGIRWVVDDRVFDNGDKYPQNKCYCTGTVCPDLHSGVQNVSDCRFGGPVFTSFPHFYLGDDYYLNSMTGMSPDRSKHEFSLTLEPKTGTPLRTDAKLQINILVEPNKRLGIFEKIPKLMIPAFWFAQTIDLNEELSKKAKIASELPSYGTYVAIAISGISAILLLSGTLLTFKKSWAVDKKMNN